MYRLVFAAAVLVAAPGALAQAPSAASPDPRLHHYLQIPEKVAPRVHVLRQEDVVFAGVIGNIVVIEQSDGLVVVDTGNMHGTGKRAIGLIRAISPKPVKAIVITHSHNDHPLGLSAFLEVWPNADVIAHAETIRTMDLGGMAGVPKVASREYEAERAKQLSETYSGVIAQAIAEAKTPEEKEGWLRAAAPRDMRMGDIAGTHVIVPKHGFTDSLTLADAEAPVELRFLGRANTNGDVAAWLPKQRVLIAGDMVVEPIPYMFSVYPSEMLAVFDKMRALRFETLVPGHGRPLKGDAYLDKLSALVRDVQAQVTPLARANVPLEQIADRTDFTAQRKAFAGDDPWLARWFADYGLNPLIESVYKEARAEHLGPKPLTP